MLLSTMTETRSQKRADAGKFQVRSSKRLKSSKDLFFCESRKQKAGSYSESSEIHVETKVHNQVKYRNECYPTPGPTKVLPQKAILSPLLDTEERVREGLKCYTVCGVLGMEPRASHVLDQPSTTKLQPQPKSAILINVENGSNYFNLENFPAVLVYNFI